jgi:hypothetical protein
MNVFKLRKQLVKDYSDYIHSILTISQCRIYANATAGGLHQEIT